MQFCILKKPRGACWCVFSEESLEKLQRSQDLGIVSIIHNRSCHDKLTKTPYPGTLLDGDCRLGKGALAKTILDTGSKSTILHPIASHPVRRYTKSSWFKAIIIPSKSLHIIDCVRLPQLDEIFRLCDNPKDFAFHAPTLREHPCHSTLLVPIKDSVERLSYLYPRGPQLRWETFTALKYLHIYSRTVFNSSQTNTIRRLPPNLEVLAISVDGCSVLDYAGARSLSNLVPLWLSVPGCKLRRIELQMSSYASAFHGPLFEEFRSLGLEVVPRGHPLDEFCESDMVSCSPGKDLLTHVSDDGQRQNDFPQSLRLGDCPGDGHSEK